MHKSEISNRRSEDFTVFKHEHSLDDFAAHEISAARGNWNGRGREQSRLNEYLVFYIADIRY